MNIYYGSNGIIYRADSHLVRLHSFFITTLISNIKVSRPVEQNHPCLNWTHNINYRDALHLVRCYHVVFFIPFLNLNIKDDASFIANMHQQRKSNKQMYRHNLAFRGLCHFAGFMLFWVILILSQPYLKYVTFSFCPIVLGLYKTNP